MNPPLGYRVRRTWRVPRAVLRRRRERTTDPVGRQMLELHQYSSAMYGFMAAVHAEPDLLHDAELDPRSVVLDVGAYTGEWAARVHGRWGARVFAFEPNPVPFRRLRALAAERPGIVALPYGLAGRDATTRLVLAGPGSTTFGGGDGPGREVALRDVVAVLDELGFDDVALMKVNIEGGEYDLLDRLAETGALERIRTVSVQFHEWIAGAHRRRRACRRALARHHVEVWSYPWVWELWRRRNPPGLNEGP